MHSPAELRWRRELVERSLRGAAAAGLVLALLLAWWPALWPSSGAAPEVIEFSTSPSAATRDSLAALQRSGREVHWHGRVGATAASVEMLREPGNRWQVAVVADSALVLRDSLGVLDSITSGVGTLTTDPLRGALQVDGAAAMATLLAPEPLALRRVLVLGRATWESRFVVVALEEAGWAVDAQLTVGRERDVQQGVIVPSATRHAVVVVLDTASLRAQAAALARAVRAGTGLVLAGEAARATPPAIRAIAAASVSGRDEPEARRLEGIPPLEALPLLTLAPGSDASTVLERRGAQGAMVARRVEAGRVIQLGYTDTWRWRMEGEGRGPAEHRAYWSRIVGLAAAAEPARAGDDANSAEAAGSRGAGSPNAASQHSDPLTFADPAPRAALVQALGPAQDAPITGSRGLPALPAWLGALLLLLFVGEWSSRRARGAP